jgi:ATP-dependent DNA ligase
MKDAQGGVRIWNIETGDSWLTFTWGQLGGATQTKTEQIRLNASGRTMVEQLMLQYNSRINRQRNKGYKDTIEEAVESKTNVLSLPKPMLATTFEKVKNIDYTSAFLQRKYDGNRCLIANCDGEIIAYTRNGKRIETISHITDNVDIPDGTILDGELYAHGETLQTIVSWVKRKQEQTKQIKYHCYDLVEPGPFTRRLAMLEELALGPCIEIAPSYQCLSKETAQDALMEFRSEGYEGAILRWGKAGYEDGKRSKSLVKLKQWHDAEFEVAYITRSDDGWGILHLITNEGAHFKATAPGTQIDKCQVADQPYAYIGRFVTVEYAYLTADGVPFHPIAKRWRDD